MALVKGSTMVFDDGVIMPIRLLATTVPPQLVEVRRQE
jgi:hypothetical protein